MFVLIGSVNEIYDGQLIYFSFPWTTLLLRAYISITRDVEDYNDWITYNNIPNQNTHCSCYYNHTIYLEDDDTHHYNRNYVSLQLFSLESSQLNNHLNKYTFRFPRTFLFKQVVTKSYISWYLIFIYIFIFLDPARNLCTT